METTIKINGNDYVLRNSTRALLKFEELTGKSVINMDSTYTNTIGLFYSMLYGANHKTFKISYDDFLDVIDEENTILDVFTSFLELQAEANGFTKDEKKKVVEN